MLVVAKCDAQLQCANVVMHVCYAVGDVWQCCMKGDLFGLVFSLIEIQIVDYNCQCT